MSTKTWIVLDKNGVPDKTFEQSGTPASMQMTSLDAGTTYVARAGMESDGLQTLALQTVTFATLQAGAITVAYVSHERASSTDTVVYSYTSTYAPSAAVLASTIGGVTTNYQGVIDSNNHRITFTITDWTVGSTYSVACRLDDIYGETATSAATSITVEEVADYFYIDNLYSMGNALYLTPTGSPTAPDLDYRFENSEEWTHVTFNGNTYIIVIPAFARCYFRGSNTSGFNTSNTDYYTFRANRQHILGGNIMSIIDKDNFTTITDIPKWSFNHLFQGDTNLTNAADMNFGNVVNHRRGVVMDYALENMFDGCTSMLYPPDMSKFEYVGLYGMHYCFANCTSLRDPADLGHVTDANRWAFLYCYERCTSLQSGSYLSNLGRAEEEYMKGMYLNCSNLYEAFYSKNATTSGVSGWLDGCAAVGVIYVPTLEVRDAIVGTSVVPSGWTVST